MKSSISIICLMFSISILSFQNLLDAAIQNLKVVTSPNGNNTCIGLSVVNGNVEVVAVNNAGESEELTTIISGDYFYQSDLKVIVDDSGNIIVVWIGIDAMNKTLSLYSNVYLGHSESWVGATQLSHVGKNLYQGFSISKGLSSTQVMWSEYMDHENTITCTSQLIDGIWGKKNAFSLY